MGCPDFKSPSLYKSVSLYSDEDVLTQMMMECHVGYDLLTLQMTSPCNRWRRGRKKYERSQSQDEETIGLVWIGRVEMCEGVRCVRV